jgi:hypothetical protein
MPQWVAIAAAYNLDTRIRNLWMLLESLVSHDEDRPGQSNSLNSFYSLHHTRIRGLRKDQPSIEGCRTLPDVTNEVVPSASRSLPYVFGEGIGGQRNFPRSASATFG